MSIRFIRGALILALVTTLAACGGDGSGDGAVDPTTEPSAGTPSAEGTAPERPAPGGDNNPAIELAGAPAGNGGSTPNDDGTLCVDVRWLGDRDDADLGEGIAFAVSEVRLAGAEQADYSCPDDPCQGFTFDSNTDNCVHAVRPGESEGTLSLYGRILCSAPAQDCADFRSRLQTRSIPIPAAHNGGEESEEPTPTEEQTHTDGPTPTDEPTSETPTLDEQPPPTQ